MTAFLLIEARLWHCGQILRRMRGEHRVALAGIGCQSHRELRACFDASSYRRAWLIDGELAALGGITGTALSCAGEVWLVLAELALRHPHHVVGEARRQLAMLAATRSQITTTVLTEDKRSLRLIMMLGFEPLYTMYDPKLLVMTYRPHPRRRGIQRHLLNYATGEVHEVYNTIGSPS